LFPRFSMDARKPLFPPSPTNFLDVPPYLPIVDFFHEVLLDSFSLFSPGARSLIGFAHAGFVSYCAEAPPPLYPDRAITARNSPLKPYFSLYLSTFPFSRRSPLRAFISCTRPIFLNDGVLFSCLVAEILSVFGGAKPFLPFLQAARVFYPKNHLLSSPDTLWLTTWVPLGSLCRPTRQDLKPPTKHTIEKPQSRRRQRPQKGANYSRKKQITNYLKRNHIYPTLSPPT